MKFMIITVSNNLNYFTNKEILQCIYPKYFISSCLDNIEKLNFKTYTSLQFEKIINKRLQVYLF